MCSFAIRQTLLAGSVATANAQSPTDPIKLGAILDMSSVYADVTGPVGGASRTSIAPGPG